jgi:hypothetical protein
MEALSQNDFPKAAEAFRQSDLTLLGSVSRYPSNKVLFVKDTVPDGLISRQSQ